MKRVASRREFIGAVAAAALPASLPVFAQGSVLPVNTPGLDHLDVIVPDVEKSARFYMGLFRTTLHAQPFQGGQRYFVLLGPLPTGREVGYLAIGDSRGRGTYIGHFCTSVAEWRRDSAAIFAQLKERVSSARFGEFSGGGGIGGIFKDPDGIEIQFLPSPDTLVTAATPSALVPAEQGLVTPLRVEYALLKVSNLDRALEFYRILYGKETRRARDSAAFAFRNGSRLLLETTSYVYGNAQARIARYGIRVREFDRSVVKQLIPTLGGTVVADDGKALRLRDADGIELELIA
jgi:catechol 2,3-dioxygenase-like lactoylglutathione lyase family enzyme